MQVISASILLLAWLTSGRRVDAQGPFCSQALGAARQSARFNQCSCPHEPICSQCYDGGDKSTAVCTNGCYYCDSTLGTCGYFNVASTYASVDVFIGDTLMTVYILARAYNWYYMKGRTGTLTYTLDTEGFCKVAVNGQQCDSCVLYSCINYSGLEPAIDCSNIEAGATATAPCSGNAFGGWASLDDSALQGILAPLAFPYYGCSMGTTHLGTTEEVFGPTTPQPTTRTPTTKKPTTRKPTIKKPTTNKPTTRRPTTRRPTTRTPTRKPSKKPSFKPTTKPL
jgi:hypothetical protein